MIGQLEFLDLMILLLFCAQIAVNSRTYVIFSSNMLSDVLESQFETMFCEGQIFFFRAYSRTN